MSEGKLDGRFVKDVSVHDGTEFAPNTRFVKIWRLRNSGTLPWPHHTQLVYVGGDQLGTTDNVTLQVRPIPSHVVHQVGNRDASKKSNQSQQSRIKAMMGIVSLVGLVGLVGWLQVGEEGLGEGEEIEVAVELSAPERPGRYVSHWRLLAPGGPKFGHRVWALIHVRGWGGVGWVGWDGIVAPLFSTRFPTSPSSVF